MDVSTSVSYIFGQPWVPVTALIVTALLLAMGAFLARRLKSKGFALVVEVKELVQGSGKTRFRKRDKVLFYGRKMLRKVSSVKEKVKSISGQVRGPPGKKRRLVMRFARRLLQLQKENAPARLKVVEPPAEYLQEDPTNVLDQRLPSEVIYMLQSIRIFGHFEKPLFLELVKHMESINLISGQFLFRIGDPDINVYVVQTGKLNVFATEVDGSFLSLKDVKAGETVTSLLSFTDVLTGQPSVFKTVCARAEEDSIVLKLPMSAFQEVFEKHPDVLVRVIQIIMVRLQRVTFLALHQYLGLSAELVKTYSSKHVSNGASPVKIRMRDLTSQKSENGGDAVSASASLATTLEPPSPSPVPMTPPFSDIKRKRGSSLMGLTAGGRNTPEYQKLLHLGTEGLVTLLGLEDDSLLKGNVEIRELAPGNYVMKEDSQKDAALVYILNGTLVVSQKVPKSDQDTQMFVAHPGELVGGLAVLTGEPSFFTVRSKHITVVATLSKNTFYSVMAVRPKVVLHIARTVIRRLSPFVRQIDFALDWMSIESGRALYRQEDESDSTYIVLSGRLRSVITHRNEKKELVGEYGRGDLVGIVETLTQTPRSTTVMAVRDTELAKLPEGLLNAIKLKYPMVVSRLINLLGHRILGTWQTPSLSHAIEQRASQSNFSTVAILPVSEEVPLTQFTYELFHSLRTIGPTLRLTSESIRKTLGPSVLEPANEYRLSAWLGQQEDQHRIVLYQCDTTLTPWTHRCIRQADCILIVALGSTQPLVGKVEKQLETVAVRTQKELILLHQEGGRKPIDTVEWLNARSWCSSHHHIQCPRRMFVKKTSAKISLAGMDATDHARKEHESYSKILQTEPSIHSDFSRLARLLTGESVGLVLGGGGARGSAHVGMIQAIQEAGIPIDMVGGVSIGSFVGALWCMEKNVDIVTRKAREWSKKMTQVWRQAFDLTYPITAMFTGAGFNQLIKDTFGDTQVEDLWLPYFAITTDITSSSMRVHTHGSLWRYVRSSMSLAGYMPPLCDPVDGHYLVDGGYVNNIPGNVWRTVRSSMSIAGLLPPVCDPDDGHLLLDADVMRSRGAKHILAIDVGSQDDVDLTNYGDSLSGWWLLWKKWNPFASPVKVPNLPDIQSRLAYVSCVRQLEEVKNSDYCEYIRPPIDKYKTLQFGSFDEIKDVGYNHGKTYFAGLSKAGLLTPFTLFGQGTRDKLSPLSNNAHLKTASTAITATTFTDLAQMVARVKSPARDIINSPFSDSDDDSEDEDLLHEEGGYVSEPSPEIFGTSLPTDHSPIRRRRRGNSLTLSQTDLLSSMDSF